MHQYQTAQLQAKPWLLVSAQATWWSARGEPCPRHTRIGAHISWALRHFVPLKLVHSTMYKAFPRTEPQSLFLRSFRPYPLLWLRGLLPPTLLVKACPHWRLLGRWGHGGDGIKVIREELPWKNPSGFTGNRDQKAHTHTHTQHMHTHIYTYVQYMCTYNIHILVIHTHTTYNAQGDFGTVSHKAIINCDF